MTISKLQLLSNTVVKPVCPPLRRTHTGERPYGCKHPGCGKAFTQLSNLQSHSRSHMTDKPFRCNSCYKCFAEEQGLREHIPKHSETKHLKTHICHVCGKSYTQETYLTRHMAKHSFDGRNPPPKLPPNTAPPTPLSPQLQHAPESPIDVKPLDVLSVGSSAHHRGSGVGGIADTKPSSAFVPLAHQGCGTSLINSSVPPSFSFSPRLQPGSPGTLGSRLPLPPTSYAFPSFDPMAQFAATSRRDDRSAMGVGVGDPHTLIGLQQIQNFSKNAMFSKSEPSSPIHKDGFS